MRITNFIQAIQQFMTPSTISSKPRVIGEDVKTTQAAADTFDGEEFNKLCQEYKDTRGTFFNSEEFICNCEDYKKGIEDGSIPRSTTPKIISINMGAAVWQKIKEKIGLGGPAQA